MQPNFAMWPYWREKYTSPVGALTDYYPEVLAAEQRIRIELIRIDAYETLIDKLMSSQEVGLMAASPDAVPLWSVHRDSRGYADALATHYAAALQQNEPLRVALQNIREAEAAVDHWMTLKASAAEPEDA